MKSKCCSNEICDVRVPLLGAWCSSDSRVRCGRGVGATVDLKRC